MSSTAATRGSAASPDAPWSRSPRPPDRHLLAGELSRPGARRRRACRDRLRRRADAGRRRVPAHQRRRPRDPATEDIADIVGAAGDDLQAAARRIVDAAYETGSGDNLTALIVRVETLPDGEPGEVVGEAADLPPAPLLEPPTRSTATTSCAGSMPEGAATSISRRTARPGNASRSRCPAWSSAATAITCATS